jgi:hypothetical protein
MSKNNDRNKKEKKVEFRTYQPRQQRANRVVIRNLQHPVQQEMVREDIEQMGQKSRNLWNMKHRVTGYLPLVTLLLRHRSSSQQQRNTPHGISTKYQNPNSATSPKAK